MPVKPRNLQLVLADCSLSRLGSFPLTCTFKAHENCWSLTGSPKTLSASSGKDPAVLVPDSWIHAGCRAFPLAPMIQSQQSLADAFSISKCHPNGFIAILVSMQVFQAAQFSRRCNLLAQPIKCILQKSHYYADGDFSQPLLPANNFYHFWRCLCCIFLSHKMGQICSQGNFIISPLELLTATGKIYVTPHTQNQWPGTVEAHKGH